MEELRSLPPETRRRIAAGAADLIRPLLRQCAAEPVRELRRRAQDERWRLVSQGFGGWADVRFGAVVLSEQWSVAKLELIEQTHPIREILAERRLRVIESFLRDSLPEPFGDAA